jgi:molecular chaperone DnaK (HSP70)
MITWGLAIDYGTSFTAAAILDESGEVEILEVEDSPRFPSSVLNSDRGLVVGKAALNQARRHPERFERAPKRLIGQPEALLDGHPVAVEEMVGAVLSRVAEAARTRQGKTDPDWVILTHPAGWYRERLDVLRSVAQRAGRGRSGLSPSRRQPLCSAATDGRPVTGLRQA